MTYNTIRYEVEDGVALITLSRPDKLNAFTPEMMREMIDAVDRTDADDAVRAVIFTGEGRAYCAGADLSAGTRGFVDESQQSLMNTDGSVNYSSEAARDGGGLLTLRLFESRKPLIGAINGAAVGIGVTMTLPMDIRLASEAARFGFVFTRRGIVPEAASSWFLPRVVGVSKALEWCYSGRVFDAQEALDGGLVRSIHAPENLLPAARAIAREIVENTAPVSVALTRQMLWRGLGQSHPMEAHRIDSRAILSRTASADAAEGVASFLEKRPAAYPDAVSKDMPDFYPWWDDQPYR
ncbi:crotonase/enoyl-CoA hydratase family protein [Brevundimonas guildfordensis]|uniref:Crotonase/enoyl-CoA hydratase family protein n=1 Tax=Brevundimonas guildfordensis TaxID=2762241 RepID=A0ABR8QW89_9CAUL|nr:crotonase/enoyl-CoA hydratase family protein [Brevundimonas guildfordensis]MBD7939789.1 crotonase/enoyl-CoA hydratase family protein [Brevundimonas guildfordensis]